MSRDVDGLPQWALLDGFRDGAKRKGAPSPHGSDDDDEKAGEDEFQRLSWRMDPEKSHSDWKIVINVPKKVGGSTTYHVHKTYLSVGPKKSEYFQRLFQTRNIAEFQTQTSKIELHELAAQTFPVFLDYQYNTWNDDLEISSENATVLFYLASYFGVPRLQKKTRQFWKKDLMPSNCWIHLKHAKIFRYDELRERVVQFCAERIKDIGGFDPRLTEVSDELLWIELLGVNDRTPNPGLVRMICYFCWHQMEAEELTAASFLRLTNEETMPGIWNAESIVPLLQLEKRLIPEAGTGSVFTALQQRCILGLTSMWDRLDTSSMKDRLAELNPFLLSTVLARMIEEAQSLKAKLEESEKRRKQAESVFPQSIVVEGAGTEAVNGCYPRDNKYIFGAPCFTKQVRVAGEEIQYEVYFNKRMRQHRIVQERNGTKCLVYSRELSADMNHVLPPTRGWTYAPGDGAHPPPTIRYNFN